MHVRDEHVRIKTKEKLRKRAFGVRVEGNGPSQSESQVETTATTNIEDIFNSLSDNSDPHENSMSISTCTLRGMTANLINLAEQADNDDNDADDEQEYGIQQYSLEDLFDFTKDHWVRTQQASAVGSLQEEEELYQLLELDADGDIDTDLDPDLDDSTENILTL